MGLKMKGNGKLNFHHAGCWAGWTRKALIICAITLFFCCCCLKKKKLLEKPVVKLWS